MAGQSGFARRACELSVQGDQWREVILRWGPWCMFRTIAINSSALLGELLAAPINERNEHFWIKAWLAGDVLLELGLERARETDLGGQQAEMVRHRLADLLKRGQKLAARPRPGGAQPGQIRRPLPPRTLPPRRTSPAWASWRFSLGHFTWAAIQNRIKKLTKDEQPQHELDLPLFYIARYPTTNAQFKAFIEDGGYREAVSGRKRGSQVWSKQGFKGRYDSEPRREAVSIWRPLQPTQSPGGGHRLVRSAGLHALAGRAPGGVGARQGYWEQEIKREAERQVWQGLAGGETGRCPAQRGRVGKSRPRPDPLPLTPVPSPPGRGGQG